VNTITELKFITFIIMIDSKVPHLIMKILDHFYDYSVVTKEQKSANCLRTTRFIFFDRQQSRPQSL
jgi:hypothetical protein